MKPAQLTRTAVAISLVVGAALIVVSVLLMPDFSGGHRERLEAIAAAQATSTISSMSFTVSQLFLAVGLVGVAHLVRSRVPVLATVGAVLVVLGGFGHAVYGGVNVVMLAMAEDLAALDTHAAVLARGEEGIGIPFMAAGLLGTVLGFIVLGVAVWRGGLGPRWVGPLLAVGRLCLRCPLCGDLRGAGPRGLAVLDQPLADGGRGCSGHPTHAGACGGPVTADGPSGHRRAVPAR
ncbi:hypothetical protein FNH13_18460 [Ornithinimicrobium ciconiae]|uniref:DUF4386 family protein n=1 Tax=Ornithinimicrobium ciconiae TaxID=2594265 RepID=A0A516GEV9_9MICO|nr:hypothetical protein [Ornithinimicrobium ciconiae]QDO90064.1 hypothetical protein FNH13_18460 [Ornithinimicrobium ciconiae]